MNLSEPHTSTIRRGKAGKEAKYGHEDPAESDQLRQMGFKTTFPKHETF